jgi:hypothetical protein
MFKDAWAAGRGNRRPADNAMFSFAVANLIRAFGDEWFEKWAGITKSRLKEWGVNTVANWSSREFIQYARLPYVVPLAGFPSTQKKIFRDFPDVFSEEYKRNAAVFAQQLEPMKDDPCLIGYFLSNEPLRGQPEHSRRIACHGFLYCDEGQIYPIFTRTV